jgi:hypothetical protein
VEEVVAKGVLLGEQTLGKVGCVEITEDETWVVAPGNELVEVT